jgi:hypothetical protein
MVQETGFNMEEEFAGLGFHSIRLEERFVKTMEALIRRPDASIWEADENRAEARREEGREEGWKHKAGLTK